MKRANSVVKAKRVEETTDLRPQQTATWQEAIEKFSSEQDVKDSSKDIYYRTTKIFFEWVEEKGKDIAELTRVDILEYKNDLFKKGLSSLTIGSYLTSLRKFYEWVEANKLGSNIAKGIKTPHRRQAYKKQHLTDDKSAELLSHFASLSLRDYAMVNLMLRTGLRTIEVVRADVGDITFLGERRILKIWGKGRDEKDDFVVLTDKAYLPIRNYLSTRIGLKAGEPLFTSDSHRNTGERLTTRTISGICKEGLKAIGLDGREYTAHSLRHTAGVAVLTNGGDLMAAQYMLRHASPSTTQIYIESIKEDLRLKNAPEQLLDKAYNFNKRRKK